MRNKQKETYQIYLEGGLHKDELSRAQALRLEEKFENEGWHVKVFKVVPTILGPMCVQVFL